MTIVTQKDKRDYYSEQDKPITIRNYGNIKERI